MQKSESISTLEEHIDSNIRKVMTLEREALLRRTPVDKLVDAIAKFCGSMAFVYIHVVLFTAWIVVNSLPLIPKEARWDPSPFTMLTLIVSLEAIFLSTFILISQNRQQAIADHQSRLDLQVNLLAEQEESQIVSMLVQVMEKLGIQYIDEESKSFAEITNIEQVAAKIDEESPDLS